jgi:hypothetical protein
VSRAKKPGFYPDGGGLYLQVNEAGVRSFNSRAFLSYSSCVIFLKAQLRLNAARIGEEFLRSPFGHVRPLRQVARFPGEVLGV